MQLIKMSFYLLVMLAITMMVTVEASHRGGGGGKLHFQDSSELGQFERTGPGQGRGRNHRGRGVGHQRPNFEREFEEGIPGVYPIRGAPQEPFVPQVHPGRPMRLHDYRAQPPLPIVQTPNYSPQLPTSTIISETPIYSPTPLVNNQQATQQPFGHHYIGNPFLRTQEADTPNKPTTTNKSNQIIFPGVTNQLTTSDKPTTTTPSYLNPRRYDLLYGSNLLLEEDGKLRDKAEETTEISFIDRGLFDTAPHCQPGYILVNSKCRMAV